MKLFNIFCTMAGIGLLSACVKDIGNFSYKKGNDVVIKGGGSSFPAILGDTVTVTVSRVFSNPDDTTEFDHAWYVDGVQVGTDPVLKYVPKDWGSLYCTYYMTDRKSGNVYNLSSPIFITVSPATMNGWGLLYEQNGKSELGHVRINTSTNQYFDYKDLYKTYNNGEELGSGPVKIRDYTISGGRGMYIIQRGGQGCIDIEAYTLKKKLVTSKSFLGGMPANFAPVDMGFYQNAADLVANDNGDLYARFTNGSLPFTVPFLSSPLTISNGLKVGDIWDSWSTTSTFAIMYDKLNKRLVRFKTNQLTTGGGVTIEPVPAPAAPYPVGYASWQNLGNWEYVWGGTFNDASGTMDGAMVLKNPTDQQYYYETFNYVLTGDKVTPKKCILFAANPYITPQTKYVAIKARSYLFFTSGSNNEKLYYYDAISENIVNLYTQFSSRINVITASDDGSQIAVGLDDGTFALYDISNATIVSGVPKELHRFSGLGRVVDIVAHNGKIN